LGAGRHAEDIEETETETGQYDHERDVLETDIRNINEQCLVAVGIDWAEKAVSDGHQRLIRIAKTALRTLRNRLRFVT